MTMKVIMANTAPQSEKGSGRAYSPSETDSPKHNEAIQKEIAGAFEEGRAFPFYPRTQLVDSIRSGAPYEDLISSVADARLAIYQLIADGDSTIEQRYKQDVRLSACISGGITIVHRVIANLSEQGLVNRRFVFIRERPGSLAAFEGDNGLGSVTHIGLGPDWLESPTIFCSLGLIDLLDVEARSGGADFYKRFQDLVEIEAKAIEEGINYSIEYAKKRDEIASFFIDLLRKQSETLLGEVESVAPQKLPTAISDRKIKQIYRLLDARVARLSDHLGLDRE